MAKPFQILVVLDYSLVEPWNNNWQSKSRLMVRAIPEMAVVPRGSQVQWLVRNFWPLKYRELHWDFYFQQGSPFRDNQQGSPFSNMFWNFQIITAQEPVLPESANHQGSTEPLIVDSEGEFKYGIRVTDPQSNQVISDEDPVIVVR